MNKKYHRSLSRFIKDNGFFETFAKKAKLYSCSIHENKNDVNAYEVYSIILILNFMGLTSDYVNSFNKNVEFLNYFNQKNPTFKINGRFTVHIFNGKFYTTEEDKFLKNISMTELFEIFRKYILMCENEKNVKMFRLEFREHYDGTTDTILFYKSDMSHSILDEI